MLLEQLLEGQSHHTLLSSLQKKHEHDINMWRERLLEHHYRSMKWYLQSQGGVSAKLEVVDTFLSLFCSQVIFTKLYVKNFLYCFGPWRKKMYFVF